MQIENIDINLLNPAPYNPRKDLKPDDKEYQKIKKSIEYFGYVDPIVVNKDLTIIGGHQRYKVLLELGEKSIQCVVVDKNKDDEKALNIALNKISGDWDLPKLKDLLEDLRADDIDITITGFDEKELNKLMAQFEKEIEDDNFDAEAEAKKIETPVTKPGDIWLLGKHRLMCGDATNTDDVEKLLDGHKANLVVTDPPYNVNYKGKAGKIQNDNMTDNEFYTFLFKAFENVSKIMADGAAIYVFHSDTEGQTFRKAFSDAGFHLANVCVWVKNALVMGRSDYQWMHEPILYGWKPTAAHTWYSDRSQTTVWNFNKPSVSAEHPTMKPLDLISHPIQNSSLPNCIVVDTFGGSGSTLIASEQLNRICFMMEIGPIYCDVIKKRWELLTGGKAELIL